MTKKQNVAIVGATGLVGSTLLSILEERDFPIDQLYLLASDRSQDEILRFNNKSIAVQNVDGFDFAKVTLALFAAANSVAEKYAKKAASHCVVIDNSSYFRYDEDIPLIVPEVNANCLLHAKQHHLISNPNCTTIQIVTALKPIYDAVGIERINIATYQSVSGSGMAAIEELAKQTAQLLNMQPVKPKVYPQQIAFNLLPHIDEFQENGYTREEMKMIWEIRKILMDETLAINPTAVRVPVFYGHGASLHIETKDKISAKQTEKLLSKAPGIKLMRGKYPYPTPVSDAAGKDEVYVGRIREDISHPRGIDLWVVADNVRKGAALNAIQIAEYMMSEALL